MSPTVTPSMRRTATTSAPPKRVAVYTRQSVDRGDEYGSTDAQREAIVAYVTSQRAHGWVALAAPYDDRGESGSTLDRPAFKRLLRDVEAGDVDVIAVYKIDRLSRSLLDFTQLMRRFEERGVEFVSVTQQFSTSTSVGRMTLNLLATFAQFERETISERTRDKIAATRRKGMWTGGHLVLGYDAVDGKLRVNAAEAERVRTIFDLYRQARSLHPVAAELRERGWTTKSWTNRAGAVVAGRAFSVPTLRRHLENALYVGQVRLGDEIHPGAHEGIVDRALFDAVQDLLAATTSQRPALPKRNKWGVLLRGLLHCGACASTMVHHFASRGTRRYGSYVCARYAKSGAAACPGARIAVGAIEGFVVERLRAIGREPGLVAATLAAAQRALAERRPAAEKEIAGCEVDRRGLRDERKHLVAAVGRGGQGSAQILERLGALDSGVTALDERERALRREIAALEAAAIDPDDLRAALTAFDPLWARLSVAERTRVMHLLLERVTFDGRTNDVAITFRANGLRSVAAAASGDEAP